MARVPLWLENVLQKSEYAMRALWANAPILLWNLWQHFWFGGVKPKSERKPELTSSSSLLSMPSSSFYKISIIRICCSFRFFFFFSSYSLTLHREGGKFRQKDYTTHARHHRLRLNGQMAMAAFIIFFLLIYLSVADLLPLPQNNNR